MKSILDSLSDLGGGLASLDDCEEAGVVPHLDFDGRALLTSVDKLFNEFSKSLNLDLFPCF